MPKIPRLTTTWFSIKTRIYNKNNEKYPIYGGRGIKCEWKSFEDFKRDMEDSYYLHVKEFGEKNTQIDRVDVNGNYCKENCRWATRTEQARNTRRNRFFTLHGRTMTLVAWEEETGLTRYTITNRIDRLGWTIEKALQTPLSKGWIIHTPSCATV
jgi:hypothetical protein